jgi:hypothetical protein
MTDCAQFLGDGYSLEESTLPKRLNREFGTQRLRHYPIGVRLHMAVALSGRCAQRTSDSAVKCL